MIRRGETQRSRLFAMTVPCDGAKQFTSAWLAAAATEMQIWAGVIGFAVCQGYGFGLWIDSGAQVCESWVIFLGLKRSLRLHEEAL